MSTVSVNGQRVKVPKERLDLERKIARAVRIKKTIEMKKAELDVLNAEIAELLSDDMDGKKSFEYVGAAGLVKVIDRGDWHISQSTATTLMKELNGKFTALVSQKTSYGLTPELRAVLKADATSLGTRLREIIPYKKARTVSIKPKAD